MAEIVGIVASGISIATLVTGVTSSIVKLKHFFDQVHDAPEDIMGLIEELEILRLVFADVEENQRRNRKSGLTLDSASLSRCLQLCKAGLGPLQEITVALSADLDTASKLRRKWGSAKVVLKKAQLDRYRIKLERAIKLLAFAHQLYTSALQQLQPDIIIAKISKSPSPGQALCETNFLAPQSRPHPGFNTTQDIVATLPQYNQAWCLGYFLGTFRYRRIRYRMFKVRDRGEARNLQEKEDIQGEYFWPSWFVNRVWKLQAIKASSGWTFIPRTYNKVPRESAVFHYAVTNNVGGLKELFSMKLASPFDCTWSGYSPLWAAATHSSYNACDFLIREGADPNDVNRIGMTPLEAMIHHSVSPREVQEKAPLLWNETEHEVSLAYYQGSGEGFSGWQQALDPTYYQRPFEERLAVAEGLMSGSDNPYGVIRRALSLDSMPLQVHDLKKIDGQFLNVVAAYLGALPAIHGSVSDVMTMSHEWRYFLVQLVRLLHHKSSLYNIGYLGGTPLLELIESLSIPLYMPYGNAELRACERIRMILGFWLECLRDGGVDLVEYGRKETELFNEGPVPRVLWYLTRKALILKSFTYGPSPSDWKICTVFRERKAVAEHQSIPGAWMEDDDWYKNATDIGKFDSRNIDIDLHDTPTGRTVDDQCAQNTDVGMICGTKIGSAGELTADLEPLYLTTYSDAKEFTPRLKPHGLRFARIKYTDRVLCAIVLF